MAKRVPIIYSFIHMKLRDSTKTSVIGIVTLKEIIKRTIIRKGGIPRYFVQDVVIDLVHYGLLSKVNHHKYHIRDNPYYNRMKQKSLFYI
jgi:hypothetical protein